MYKYREYTFDVIGAEGSRRWRVYATPAGLLINFLTGTRSYATTYEAYDAAKQWIDRQLDTPAS